MKPRDTRRDEAYFDEFINEKKGSLHGILAKLNNNEIREDRILPVKKFMQFTKYNMMIAKYSAGYPLEEVKRDYVDVLSGMIQYWKDNPELSTRINMLSIGIILEIEDEHFEALVKFYEETGVKEYMFDC